MKQDQNVKVAVEAESRLSDEEVIKRLARYAFEHKDIHSVLASQRRLFHAAQYNKEDLEAAALSYARWFLPPPAGRMTSV